MTRSRRPARSVCIALLFLTSLSHPLRAQSDDARITGIVTDSSKAVIRGAKVDLINVATGVHYPTVTNEAGVYRVSGQVGNYRLEIAHAGFKTVIAPNIALHTQDALQINIEMAVGAAEESVTVSANATNDNPAVSLTVTREFVENMPLNGRSFQDLIQLAPGTVSTQNGYFSIDGQRTDSNNYTVDGVSANLGGLNNNSSPSFGSRLSGSSPSQTVIGTTQSLASIDSLQEFTIQTSGYSAEFGRNPGGQAQFTTRSGTNELHGSLFEYLRNTALDANGWIDDHYGIPQTAEHQNDFGGTLGGPLLVPKFYNGKDKTFYMISYEGLRLLLPAFESEYVPTQAFRSAASPNVQPFLNASPLPSPTSSGNQDGCTVDGAQDGPACDALFNYGYSYPNNVDNYSARIDQNFGKRLHAFVRYADTPSSEVTGAEQLYSETINTHTWTVGVTGNIDSNMLDDFHFNYSRDGEEQTQSLRRLGGSVPWARGLLIPAAYDGPYAFASPQIQVPGTSLGTSSTVGAVSSAQHQYQAVDSIAWTRGKHSLKFGVDWRRLAPTYVADPYQSELVLDSLAEIQQGYASALYVAAQAPGKPVFDNLSLYAQDHWKISRRLSVDCGLRWEFNPPPEPSNGHYPVTLTSDDLATAQLAPLGTPAYKTNHHSFAPRIGFAWNAIPSQTHPLTVRSGFGIFFDTGQSTAASAYTGDYPFSAAAPTQTDIALPLSSTVLAPPALNVPLSPPYPLLNGISGPNLTLPYTEQWNLSIDERLNVNNTLSLSYVGNNGRKLLFTQYYASVPGNPDFSGGLAFTNNGSQSSYNAMQIQDIGRLASGLDLVASFTWAHALDNASNNSSDVAPRYGNSDYDLRRTLNLALNYQTAAAGHTHWMQAMTHGWLLANRFSMQSGYPVNIVQSYYVQLNNGTQSDYSPDLVSGVPIYLHGSAADLNGQPVPHNWRLNSAAFSAVPTDPNTGYPIRNGTLGRNYVRNPSFLALNTALQRSFPVHEGVRLDFRAEGFNILNHPSLGGPDTGLSDSAFGQLIGGATTIGSSNQLYAMGAARSLQLSLKLQF